MEARNAEQAKQAAQKIWDEEWNKRYDPEPPEPEQVLFADFVEETYLPWSKMHKASFDDDVRTTTVLNNFFKGRTCGRSSPQ